LYAPTSKAKNLDKTMSHQTETQPVVPRTLTKYALREYFGLKHRAFRHLITPEIISAMGLNHESHKRLRTYNVEQTKIIIKKLELSEEELIGINEYQKT
jgi:hypothetical protein